MLIFIEKIFSVLISPKLKIEGELINTLDSQIKNNRIFLQYKGRGICYRKNFIYCADAEGFPYEKDSFKVGGKRYFIEKNVIKNDKKYFSGSEKGTAKLIDKENSLFDFDNLYEKKDYSQLNTNINNKIIGESLTNSQPFVNTLPKTSDGKIDHMATFSTFNFKKADTPIYEEQFNQPPPMNMGEVGGNIDNPNNLSQQTFDSQNANFNIPQVQNPQQQFNINQANTPSFNQPVNQPTDQQNLIHKQNQFLGNKMKGTTEEKEREAKENEKKHKEKLEEQQRANELNEKQKQTVDEKKEKSLSFSSKIAAVKNKLLEDKKTDSLIDISHLPNKEEIENKIVNHLENVNTLKLFRPEEAEKKAFQKAKKKYWKEKSGDLTSPTKDHEYLPLKEYCLKKMDDFQNPLVNKVQQTMTNPLISNQINDLILAQQYPMAQQQPYTTIQPIPQPLYIPAQTIGKSSHTFRMKSSKDPVENLFNQYTVSLINQYNKYLSGINGPLNTFLSKEGWRDITDIEQHFIRKLNRAVRTKKKKHHGERSTDEFDKYSDSTPVTTYYV